MRKILKGVQLLMVPYYFSLLYCVILVTLIILMIAGFSVKGESVTWYNMELVGFHIENEKILANAYIEFVCHIWWLALAFLGCLALKNCQKSWTGNFQNFLRFSNKSCLYIEIIRILTLFIIILLTLVPFFIASLAGNLILDISLKQCLHLFYITSTPLLYIESIIYLASCSSNTIFLTPYIPLLPFFSGGIAHFIEKQNGSSIICDSIPRLPYFIKESTSSKVFIAGLIFWITVVIIRILFVCKTKCLTNNEKDQ